MTNLGISNPKKKRKKSFSIFLSLECDRARNLHLGFVTSFVKGEGCFIFSCLRSSSILRKGNVLFDEDEEDFSNSLKKEKNMKIINMKLIFL
jgi:hypothetical protein